MCKICIKIFILVIMIFSICFSFTISSFEGYWINQRIDNDDEIFYYDGTTITQLTDNDYDDLGLSINDSGEVVWHSRYYDAPDGGGGQGAGSGCSSGGGGGNIGPSCLISTAVYGSVCQRKYWRWRFFLSLCWLFFTKLEKSLRTKSHSLFAVQQRQGWEILCLCKLHISPTTHNFQKTKILVIPVLYPNIEGWIRAYGFALFDGQKPQS